MADLPFMPIATDALLSDAGDLPNVLFGAYCRLLFRWWREGAQPEKNSARLARWAGLSSAEFEDLKEFLTETDEGWTQKRLMETYAKVAEKSEKARIAAARRWGSERNADACENMEERNANHNHNHSSKINLTEGRARRAKKSGFEKGKTTPIVGSLPTPEEPALAELWRRLIYAVGEPKARSWLVTGGKPALEQNCSGYVLRVGGNLQREKLENDMRGKLDAVLGKGSWRTEPGT